MIILIAPPNVHEVNYMGDTYRAADGMIELPDRAADLFVDAHGFIDPNNPAHRAKINNDRRNSLPNDSDPIEPDDQTVSDAAEYAASLTQAEMKAYLRANGVTPPKVGTVRDMRDLVEKVWNDTHSKIGFVAEKSHVEEPAKK